MLFNVLFFFSLIVDNLYANQKVYINYQTCKAYYSTLMRNYKPRINCTRSDQNIIRQQIFLKQSFDVAVDMDAHRTCVHVYRPLPSLHATVGDRSSLTCANFPEGELQNSFQRIIYSVPKYSAIYSFVDIFHDNSQFLPEFLPVTDFLFTL